MADGQRLIVGVTGAPGAIYGVRLMEALAQSAVETRLAMDAEAAATLERETGMTAAELGALADAVYDLDGLDALGADAGMIVAPCDGGTIEDIVAGDATGFVAAVAGAILEAGGRLVLMVTQTPLDAAILRSLSAVTERGAVVISPAPAFYQGPETVDDILAQSIGRALDLFGLDLGLVKRWRGTADGERAPQRRC